jgi:hypothetical protein
MNTYPLKGITFRGIDGLILPFQHFLHLIQL